MNDFQVTLHFDEFIVPVQEYHWAVVQTTDEHNRPQASVLAGKLHLVVDCLVHAGLDAWMANSRKLHSGHLRVLGPDGFLLRTLHFVDAYCVNQGLFFDGMSTRRSGALSVLLSARLLTVDQELKMANHWPSIEEGGA